MCKTGRLWPHAAQIKVVTVIGSDIRKPFEAGLRWQELMGRQCMRCLNTRGRRKQAAMLIEEWSAKSWMMSPHELHRFSAFIGNRFLNVQRCSIRFERERLFHEKRDTDGSHPAFDSHLLGTVFQYRKFPRYFADLAVKTQFRSFVDAVITGIWKQFLPTTRIEIHERRCDIGCVLNIRSGILQTPGSLEKNINATGPVAKFYNVCSLAGQDHHPELLILQ